MNGIDFNLLSQILNSLPGTTTIIKIDSDPNSYSFRIDAENPNFQDGTEIVGNFKTHYQTPPQGQAASYVHIFNGVELLVKLY